MPLVQRYDPAAEYAALITTARPKNAASAQRRRGGDPHTWLAQQQCLLSSERAAWGAALFPPLADVRCALRRMHADPEMSQDAIFRFLLPLVWFAGVIIAGLVCLQNPHAQARAQSALRAPGEHRTELAHASVIIVALASGSAIVLRALVWFSAQGMSMFIDSHTAADPESSNKKIIGGEGDISQDSLLGAIFS